MPLSSGEKQFVLKIAPKVDYVVRRISEKFVDCYGYYPSGKTIRTILRDAGYNSNSSGKSNHYKEARRSPTFQTLVSPLEKYAKSFRCTKL